MGGTETCENRQLLCTVTGDGERKSSSAFQPSESLTQQGLGAAV